MEKSQFVTDRNISYTIFKQKTELAKKPTIVSVADLGCLEKDYFSFLNLPNMRQLLTRCQWLIILLPGQEEGAIDWDSSLVTPQQSVKNSSDVKSIPPRQFAYPKFQDMALDVLGIIQKLQLNQVVLFGEGLGANLLARVAILDEVHVMGAILLHCRGVVSGPLAGMRDKMQQWRVQKLPKEAYTEKQFIDHRFGCASRDYPSLNLKEVVVEFQQRLTTKLNAKNLKLLSIAYEQRSSLTDTIGHLHCPVLFLAGKHSSCIGGHRALIDVLKRIKTTISKTGSTIESIEYDDTVNPLIERPEKVAESLRCFLQGLGLVGSISGQTKTGVLTTMPRQVGKLAVVTDVPLSPKHGSSPTVARKFGAYPVRRQLSMAELDLPRGPSAFSSSKPTNSPSTPDTASFDGDNVGRRAGGRLYSCQESSGYSDD